MDFWPQNNFVYSCEAALRAHKAAAKSQQFINGKILKLAKQTLEVGKERE